MKRKLLFPISSVLVSASLLCTTIAFKTPAPVRSKVIQVWQFSASEPLSNAQDASKYANITGGGGYTCSGSGNVCTVSFDTSKFPSLQAYLSSFSSPAALRDAMGTVKRS